jgi:hypothetical protein
VYNLIVVDADRQRAVAGAISTYGIRDLASTASCDHPVTRKKDASVQNGSASMASHCMSALEAVST